MMDPSNLRSMVQMQQAMQQLSGGMPGMMGIPASPAPAGGLDFSNLLGTSGTRSGITAAAPMVNPFMFPLMPPAASGDGGPAAVIGGSAAQPAPGQRFRQQLQSLQDMGFTDRSANIRALSSAHGNVNRAIEILLESPPEMADSSEVAATDETGDDVGAVSQGDNDGAGASSMPKDSSEKKND
jgi:ubiquilin